MWQVCVSREGSGVPGRTESQTRDARELQSTKCVEDSHASLPLGFGSQGTCIQTKEESMRSTSKSAPLRSAEAAELQQPYQQGEAALG